MYYEVINLVKATRLASFPCFDIKVLVSFDLQALLSIASLVPDFYCAS